MPSEEEAVATAEQILADRDAAEHAEAIVIARTRVVALALNLESLYLIQSIGGEGVTTVPDGYMETAHEPLDRAVIQLAEMLAGNV